MWSGPRNLSTALMRSFGSRSDCNIVDEPFYSAYLKKKDVQHPLQKKILQTQSTNSKTVSLQCRNGSSLLPLEYQKQMSQHMIGGFDRSFILHINNAFLIRSPVYVVRSFQEKLEKFEFEELGFLQQSEIFKMVSDKLGNPAPVIDAADLLNNPEKCLKKLCAALQINYSKTMLKWKTGPHHYDGVWGSYWYSSVNKSTGFNKPIRGKDFSLSPRNAKLVDLALPFYEELSKHKLNV